MDFNAGIFRADFPRALNGSRILCDRRRRDLLDVCRSEADRKKVGAIVAVNGEAAGAAKAMAVRNGAVYQPSGKDGTYYMRLYKNGKCDFGPMNVQNQNQLVSAGVYNTVRYQYILIENGKKIPQNETYYHSRTVVAQVSENKYILAVGEFMPSNWLADILLKY